MHLTLVYRTLELLILGALFCKHASMEAMEETYWALINPEQTQYVMVQSVKEFLEKLQSLAIDIPYQHEKQRKEQDHQLMTYFKKIDSMKEKALNQILEVIHDSPRPQLEIDIETG
mmetsp:Transcript_18045/g.30769  ORF Transcript_18045/g.30769 Transcript_18045/m.30769 type:complete len:116 (+) Transcript_18045:449-796(+)